MNTSTELQNEVAKLRSDLAALRQEFDSVARVYRDDDGKIDGADLRSTGVFAQTFMIMSHSKKPLGMITSDGDNGPCISLWGKDERAKVLLRVVEDSGSIEIKGDKLETAVRICEDEGHGNVIVFSPGEVPRAIMKGMETGGAVSALSPEGKSRAIMHSIKDSGEFVVAKEKTLVKLSAFEGGGTVATFDADGEPGNLLLTTLSATASTPMYPAERRPFASSPHRPDRASRSAFRKKTKTRTRPSRSRTFPATAARSSAATTPARPRLTSRPAPQEAPSRS